MGKGNPWNPSTLNPDEYIYHGLHSELKIIIGRTNSL